MPSFRNDKVRERKRDRYIQGYTLYMASNGLVGVWLNVQQLRGISLDLTTDGMMLMMGIIYYDRM